ncbi:MAG TPA: LysR substrate-binding domain-containing protein [Bordetella sp.]
MDVRALRYFVETVRCANFTQAARKLFVTQSTISKMIRQLETETGAQLLIRDGHTARPTDAGRVVYERGVQVLDVMRQLSAELQETTQLERGTLEVGIPPMINVLFTPAVKRFRERYPHIALRLHEDTGRSVERQVASGELEVGATVLPLEPGSPLQIRRFGNHAIWAIGKSGAPWNGKTMLPLSALAETPLILTGDDFALTRLLRQAFQDAGLQPRIAAQSAHWDFLVSMASADLGVALLPEPLMRRMNTRGLSTAKLARTGLQWELAHIWQGQRYLSHAARAWLEVCQETMGKAAHPAA